MGIPNVIDRWVQQALQVLNPSEPVFHKAVTDSGQTEGRIPQSKDLFGGRASSDLSKFFDRVNHQRLLGRLSRRVKDRRVVTLIKRC